MIYLNLRDPGDLLLFRDPSRYSADYRIYVICNMVIFIDNEDYDVRSYIDWTVL